MARESHKGSNEGGETPHEAPNLMKAMRAEWAIDKIYEKNQPGKHDVRQAVVRKLQAFRKKSSSELRIQLDTDDDSLMMNLKMPQLNEDGTVRKDGQGRILTRGIRCLIDSGATISCVATKFVEKNKREFTQHEQNSAEPVMVTFANDEQSPAGRCFHGMKFYEKVTRAQLCPPDLHELPLPDNIDCLLGMDWLKRFNPVINWQSGELEFTANEASGFNPATLKARHGRKQACWLKTAPSALVSFAKMQEIRDSGQPVFMVRVEDARITMSHYDTDRDDTADADASEGEQEEYVVTENISTRSKCAQPPFHVRAALRDARVRLLQAKAKQQNKVLRVQSLTKQRLDSILQDKDLEAELVPVGSEPITASKVDPRHDNGKPKLFLNQPETEWPEINAAINEAKDIHVLELTPDHVSANDNNSHRAELLEHPIELQDGAKPTNRAYYRMSKPELEELKRQIEKYLDAGMIRPSMSPFGAACLFAPKKNGKLRFCIDYRPLNNITKRNAATPPAAEDCLNQMAGCKIFSCVDLAMGYHQIPIRLEDREKTAFNTKYGHYEWTVLPFGLCNAPATFVQSMNRIFTGEAFRAGLASAQGPHAERMAKLSDEQKAELSENLLDKFVSVFIDDILVFSKTPEEHAEHLRRVFNRLREYGLLIQSPKAFYAQREIDFLGHIITQDGITMQDDKIQTVKDWPTPESASHIRQFLGLSGFYRRFIKDYAKIAKPLSDLTKKSSEPFTWTPEAEKAFDALKHALTTAPVLAIPDPARGKFHINCDACDFGLGATLSQEGEDGKLHPCAYASRVLKPSEVREYKKSRCIYVLELEALMYSLDKWRYYLEGQTATSVDTDHKSLIWLHTQAELTQAQTKFLDTLARFDLRIRYLKGELNVPGDVPSRNPEFKRAVDEYLTDAQLNDYHSMRDEVKRLKEELSKLNRLSSAKKESVTMADGRQTAKIRRLTHARLSLVSQQQRRLEYARSGMVTAVPYNTQRNAWLSRIAEAYEKDPEYSNREESGMYTKFENNGVELWYRITKGDELPPTVCVPNEPHLKELILKEFHAPPTIGHYNGEDMFSKMRRSYYWKDMRKDCGKYAAACEVCIPHKPNLSGRQGLLAEPEFPGRPWSSIALDFFGPFNQGKSRENTCILVAVCRLTKMAHFIPCSVNATAIDIADLLLMHVIKYHGLADDYRSDRDKIFTAKVWERIWSRLGTSLSLGTAYHHQTAGQVERVNQELRRYLAIYTKSHAEWETTLPLAELAYNSHRNMSTGCTPFELNYGFQPKNPNELITPEPLRSKEEMTAAERKATKSGDQWLSRLADMWEQSQEKLRKTYTRYQKWYNQGKVDAKDLFPVGSRAYLSTKDFPNLTTVGRETGEGQDENVKRKLLPFFVGPYEVMEICGKGDLNRRLKLSTTLNERLGTDVFHVEKLKPVGERDKPFSVADTLEPPETTDGEFHVEKIVAFEQRPQGKRYLVKWLGYPDSGNTWEWEWMLENAQDKVREFMRTAPTARNPVRPRRPRVAVRRKRSPSPERRPTRAKRR